MNSSELVRRACDYLGCHGEVPGEMHSLVEDCLGEARSLSRFRAVAREYRSLLPFLEKEPYRTFLAGCSGYVFAAMTLGSEIERRIRALMTLDPARAVVLDACASALVECEGDAWEERFGADRTYRFCPGYGGSGIGDNAEIFRELDPSRIGMQLLPSGMIAPQKSMAGIIGLGKSAHKSCTACMIAGNCQYRKEGRTCYGSEKNC